MDVRVKYVKVERRALDIDVLSSSVHKKRERQTNEVKMRISNCSPVTGSESK